MRVFSPDLFRFLRDLAENNDRKWFDAHRERYETVLLDPSLEFITGFGPLLHQISPQFNAIPRRVGGSLFRIHRDVRFSKDKSPYKTHVGIHFRHSRHKDAHAPGFYLHLQPRNCFAGMGIWRPDGSSLKKIREAISAKPAAWRKATGGKAFTQRLELAGESLTRPPRGFDPEHPLIDDLKRKSFIAVATLTHREVLAADFLKSYAGLCRRGAPLVRFLCDALGLEFA